MLDQPAPLIHMMGDVIRPAPGRQFVFAYDDAMDETVMQGRCPEPKFVGTAKCTGRRLVFTADGATVITRLGSEVHGTVWEMDAAALVQLDASMDAFRSRQRRCAFARTGEGRLMLTDIYALRNPNSGQPNPALVLRVAALGVRLGFPATYTKQIRGWLGASIH